MIKDINSFITIFESEQRFIPKFTIAIPTFKRSDLLKQAIDSALNQTDFENYDVIVVDNNPERNCETEQLLNKYNNHRLSYYKNTENLGACGNWNRLYTLAKGEWVIMLHDDDLVSANFLLHLDEVQKHLPNFDLYVPKNTPFYSQESVPLDNVFTRPYIVNYREISKKDFYFKNAIDEPVGLCIKRDVFLKTSGFNPYYAPPVDYEFFARFSEEHKICKILNPQTTYYRILCNDSLNFKTLIEMESVIKRIKLEVISDFLFLKRLIYTKAIAQYTYLWLHDYKTHFKVSDFEVDKFAEMINLRVNKLTIFAYKIVNKINRKKRKKQLHITIQ